MAPRRSELLAHPAFCGAVAVLALNDAVLKRAWPGLITGKVSDIAGVFVVGVLASVVLRSTRIGLGLAAVGFATLKLVPAVASAAAPLLGGRTVTDPTDLVALAALWPAARFLRAGHDRVVRSWGTAAVATAAWCSVVLTTTATSCERLTGVESFVVADDGSVAARSTRNGSAVWFASNDGGLTWRSSAAPVDGRSSSTEWCAGARCLRLVGQSVEQRVGDGPWAESFAFRSDEVARMRRRDTFAGCGRPVDDQFLAGVSVANGVLAVDLVAMGTQGVLRRVDGGPWERRAVGDYRPVSVGPLRLWLRWLAFAPALLIPAGVLAGLVGRRHRVAATLIGVIGGAGLAMISLGVSVAAGPESVPVHAGIVAVTAVAVSWLAWLAARRPSAPPDPPWPPPTHP